MSNESDSVTYIIKIINVGSWGVGKTSLALRYTQNKFNVNYLPTLGVDFYSKMITLEDNVKIKLVLFDTLGQERYSSLRKRYYVGAHGAVIVYDVTRKETSDNIEQWIEEVSEKCPNIPIIIVGNKTDLQQERQVELEEVEQKFGRVHTVLESSAKLGEGVEDIYTLVAKKVLKKINQC